MSARKTKPYTYVKVTRLSDDFKHLVQTPTPPKDVEFKRPIDYCVVCLGHFRVPRTLACHHRYCKECLQLSIDSSPVIPEPDRGFECVLCGYFTKVPNYSIPRTEWATLMTPDYLQQQLVSTLEEAGSGVEQGEDTQDVKTNEWSLVWQISAYPRSYLRTRRLNPFKRTRNAYIFVENEEDATARTDVEAPGNADSDRTVEDSVMCNGKESSAEHYGSSDIRKSTADENVGRFGKDSKENVRSDEAKEHVRSNDQDADAKATDGTHAAKESDDSDAEYSDITAAVFYDNSVIVYDRGLQEAQLYNSKMTLERIIKARDVFDMAVVGHILYMTVPKQKTVYGYNLREQKRIPSIQLTHKCYGLDNFDNNIAILLCDTEETDFQIAFMKDVGVIGGKTGLSTGEYQFKKPQYLAVCSLTRLAYISDRKAHLLKCFRLDGGLCWEKVVVGAGPLAIYSGYLIMSREYTSSVDVFAGGGEYRGRLRSVKYAIVRPQCIAAKEHSAAVVLVDEDQLIHRYQISKDSSKTGETGGSRACVIL